MSNTSITRISRYFGWVFVAACAAFLVAPFVEGEWHAIRGHYFFLQKSFDKAPYHLEKVADRATAYQLLRGLPPMRRYLAQSLLATGRKVEASGHYEILAERNPHETTARLVAAVRKWELQDREDAVRRLEALVASAGTCEACNKAHQTLNASLLARDALEKARLQKAGALGAVGLPAKCLTYRTGVLAAKLLAGHLTKSFITTELLSGVVSKKAAAPAVVMIRTLLDTRIREVIELTGENIGDLEKSCAKALEIPKFPSVKGVEISGIIADILNSVPYVKDGKHIAADLHAIGEAGLGFASAYVEEWNSEQTIAAGEEHVTKFWERLSREALIPEFVITGVEGLVEPPEKGLWRRLRDSLPW